LYDFAKSFPIVCVIGPRQSGKTTIAKLAFPEYGYVSLEDLDNRSFAQEDPRGFLAEYSGKTIIDEAQRAPELFSYLQTQVDELDLPGQYIITGSAHLSLLENLSQSLAGRAGLLKLLPLSIAELKQNNLFDAAANHGQYINQLLLRGFYPRIYKHAISPVDWYNSYVETYLEKDVREILNIKNILLFKKFIGLCAGRHGQLLNVTSLGNECGITRQTVNDWLAILEASFIIYLLPPFHSNFNKRLIKSPKLYFYDPGVVCSLLKIESVEQLKKHYQRGAIFEGFVMGEIIKYRYNLGLPANCYFWRDQNGHEVDCVFEVADNITAIEIKSGQTIVADFFKGLNYWEKLSDKNQANYLVYGGNINQSREKINILSWDNIEQALG
jgi:predicted AAA+ superfamily ATPase